MNLDTIGSLEIVNHVCSCLFVSMVKDVVFRVHLPFDLMHLVGSVRAILGHDNGTFELSVDKACVVSHSSISNQSETMVN